MLDTLKEGLDVNSSSVSRYTGYLRINPVKNTRLVEIQFTTPDPTLSQVLANAHARGFIRYNLEARTELRAKLASSWTRNTPSYARNSNVQNRP